MNKQRIQNVDNKTELVKEKEMKKSTKFVAFILTLFLVQLFIVVPAFSSTNTWVMTGKVSAIDHHYNTVVVNVLLAKGKIFTVAGPLAPNAVVKKADKIVSLNNIKIGDKVIVKFHNAKTAQGPEITLLVAEK